MKRFIATIILCAVFSLSAFAQMAVVGNHTMFGEPFKVEAFLDYGGDPVVSINIMDEFGNKDVYIVLYGKSDIQSFRSAMVAAKSKYDEWRAIAKTNGVTSLLKEIPVEFPEVYFQWKSFDDYCLSSPEQLRPQMLISQSDGLVTYYFSITGEAHNSDNENFTKEYFMAYTSSTEMQSLINALSWDKIQSAIARNQNNSNLFK